MSKCKDPNKQRMPRWNYCEPGYYFITLVVEGRRHVFGEVVGDSRIPRGHEGGPRMHYTLFGQKVVNELQYGMLGTQWEGKVVVKCRQVMPDHIHVLYWVKEPLPKHLGHLINGFHAGCRRIMRELVAAESAKQTQDGQNRGLPMPDLISAGCLPSNVSSCPAVPSSVSPTNNTMPSSVSSCPAFPSSVSPTNNTEQISLPKLFEDGYNDGVVIRRGQLDVYFRYIRDNMRRLLLRQEHPDLFRKVWRKELIPGQSFDLIGNMFLLDWPWRIPVRISRYATDADGIYLQPKRMKTEEEVAESIRPYLAEAERGAVLVTPCISPAEQALVQAAYQRGLRVIMLCLNGFSPYYKPSGPHIDACSRGLLLQISPWSYNPNRQCTKPVCEMLNTLATQLCSISLSSVTNHQ